MHGNRHDDCGKRRVYEEKEAASRSRCQRPDKTPTASSLGRSWYPIQHCHASLGKSSRKEVFLAAWQSSHLESGRQCVFSDSDGDVAHHNIGAVDDGSQISHHACTISVSLEDFCGGDSSDKSSATQRVRFRIQSGGPGGGNLLTTKTRHLRRGPVLEVVARS